MDRPSNGNTYVRCNHTCHTAPEPLLPPGPGLVPARGPTAAACVLRAEAVEQFALFFFAGALDDDLVQLGRLGRIWLAFSRFAASRLSPRREPGVDDGLSIKSRTAAAQVGGSRVDGNWSWSCPGFERTELKRQRMAVDRCVAATRLPGRCVRCPRLTAWAQTCRRKRLVAGVDR